MTNKTQKELLDSYAKKSLLDNNSKFVELSTQFTVEVLKERLAFFEQATDVSIVGDLCKYVINDFMEHMLDNGKDRELSIDELEDIYHKTAQRFLYDLEKLTNVKTTRKFKNFVVESLGNIGIAFIDDYDNEVKRKVTYKS